MKCMCPNCGKIIPSGKLSFDFTVFIRDKLGEQMANVDDYNVTDGRDILLNAWRKNDPILLAESDLWSCPTSGDFSDKLREKGIRFSIPVTDLLDKARQYESSDKDEIEKVGVFLDWLGSHRDEISQKTYSLRLISTGDGDIKFDRIPGVAEERKCPFCHSSMSYWAGRYPEITLTVLGGPRVSKSTAVTACVASFIENRDSEISFEGSDTDSGYLLFKQECLAKYERGSDLGATDVNSVNIPRVSFRVTIKGKKLCLTFIDVPGEFNNESGIDPRLDERYTNIFNAIDFVWYCTDPAEVQQLQSSVIVSDGLGYQDKAVMDTSRIKHNMRILSAYFAHSGRKVPVAYIMGKTDSEAITMEDKQRFDLYHPDRPETSIPFDVNAFFRRSEKVRSYIKLKNRDGLIQEFEDLFKERCYVATSAYGYNPKDVTVGKNIIKKSYNCKEAFYWMLALRNCIDVKVETITTHFFGRYYRVDEVVGKISELPDELREKTYWNLYMKGSYKS